MKAAAKQGLKTDGTQGNDKFARQESETISCSIRNQANRCTVTGGLKVGAQSQLGDAIDPITSQIDRRQQRGNGEPVMKR